MLADLAAAPNTTTWVFLAIALLLALGFEFVNGFHDTANAVATVIYTHSLKPTVAVIWSGLWNLIGVMRSTGTVAYGIVALLPMDLVLNVGSSSGFAMVFALLISAIIWNFGTWYLGLPASSSHTLVGSILGVGIANSLLSGHAFGEGVNWAKAEEVGLSLLISPLVGFAGAALLVLLLKKLVRNPALFTEPKKDAPPPLWIRAILIGTCTGVSYAHGSNDGQKGMGLIVLILVGILPGMYALKMNQTPEQIHALLGKAQAAQVMFAEKAGKVSLNPDESIKELDAYVKPSGKLDDKTYAAVVASTQQIQTKLGSIQSFNQLPEGERHNLRTDIYLVGTAVAKLVKNKALTDSEVAVAKPFQEDLDHVTKYIPDWVKYAVAVALGLGTTVGWKRIVVTVGEKIGKSHLTYGQGASAELIAMCTILLADAKGLPVSTTHVLSSGIAGTMAANRSGLQGNTLRNILLAWVLTLPACVFLGSLLFAFGNYIVFNLLGLK
ncbi:MAG TPA: inorganic phosphate transporter [Chthoniobacter sp.]